MSIQEKINCMKQFIGKRNRYIFLIINLYIIFILMIYRIDIQGLRGIAVLFVLFYHIYPKKISGGFIGVDIFFVISGYLVCYSIENRIKMQKNSFFITFYAARIRRLFPASFLTLLLVTVYIYKNDFTYFSIYKKDAISSLLIFANYNFYSNKVDYFHAGMKESPILHFWSLSLEEQFYIVSPILVWISYNNVMLLYLIMSFVSLLLCIYYGMKDKNKAYFFLSSRSWEFVCGALVRYIPQNDHNDKIFYSNISVLMIIILSIYYNDKIIYPSYNAILPVLLSSYTLYHYNNNILISNNIICMIGNLSYSIYLIHFPLKIVANNSLMNYYVILAFSVIVSYNIVELPFYKGHFILSDLLTYIIALVFALFFFTLAKHLNKSIEYKLKRMKHYSSAELFHLFNIQQRTYCCLKENTKLHKSSILFIGDSHIEQYIVALLNSEYKFKYHLLHIYVHTNSYRSIAIKSYISKIILKYHFDLCIIGNFVESPTIYSDINDLSAEILKMCSKVLISNDNPYHLVDPNSCLKENKDDCFGEINKTCIIPKPFIKPSNKNIDVVTFWDRSIIKNNKCFYFNKYLPIYADLNHFTLFQLKLYVKNIEDKISSYIGYDKDYKYNEKCPYYHMPKSSYRFTNLSNIQCYQLKM